MSATQILNLIAVVAGTVFFSLGMMLLDGADSISIPIPFYVIVVVLFNWWGLYAHLRFKLRMVRIIASIAIAFIVLFVIGYLALDEDDFENALGVVGISLGVEGIGWGIYMLIRRRPKGAPIDMNFLPETTLSDRTVIPQPLRTIMVFFQIVGGFAIFGLSTWAFVETFEKMIGVVIVGDLFLLFLNGWAVYAFLRGRQGRQDELAQVLVAAVTTRVPLPAAVRSYLYDRPQSDWRTALSVLARIALPLYTYTRLWIGWRPYDRLVEELADRLESGESLSAALRSTRGVACREVRLAAAVGEATGKLGKCLANAERERWAAAWFEVAPQILYPFVVLLIVIGITAFITVYIVPKFKKIFDEFGEPLPPLTETFVEVAFFMDDYLGLFAIAKLFGLVALALVIADPTARWQFPVLGRLYRWGIQATVLRTLGRLLAAGQTVPQALEFLRDTNDLPQVVLLRLENAVTAVNRGETLDRALESVGLLSPEMSPLLRAAERARVLPWTLIELGDHLSGRAFRLVRRITQIVAPLCVVAVGALVAFIALAMFMPLIHLLTRLAI